MTELEKIERARMYMDKLANGINPIDDTMAPDEDIINNVHLSRCFFYVSDILRQVIENGGVGATEKPKKEKKEPLQIPFEKRSSFAFSEKPIPASEITRRINDLGDSEKMQKLSYNGIISWLSELGMLTWATAMDGKKTKHPTPSGTEAGILIENRNGSKGPYQGIPGCMGRPAPSVRQGIPCSVCPHSRQGESPGTPRIQAGEKESDGGIREEGSLMQAHI
jgi:hypothetical protein